MAECTSIADRCGGAHGAPRRGVLLFALYLASWGCAAKPAPSMPDADARVIARLDSSYLAGLVELERRLSVLERTPQTADAAQLQTAFRAARDAYKRIEYRLEYSTPTAVPLLNGAPLLGVDEDDASSPLKPTGFQVIEADLFPEFVPTAREGIRAEARNTRMAVNGLRNGWIEPLRGRPAAFDALRQELARVTTLGLAGYDAAASRNGLREAAAALAGMRTALGLLRPDSTATAANPWRELDGRLAATIAALEQAPNFETFDRLDFIVRDARPIGDALDRFQSALGVRRTGRAGAWSTRVATIFDPGAFDPRFFAPDSMHGVEPALAALGARLFFSPDLSRDRRRSCGTCHQPALAFTDGQARATVNPGPGVVRNTPTLLHAGLQRALFADQRAPSLEVQASEVLRNPRELDLPVEEAAARLRHDSTLVREFAAAVGTRPDSAITGRTVQLALAAFIRSLGGLGSRFDRATAGDTAALSGAERRGFTLFMGKATCGTCHFAPLFGGSLPPAYAISEPEVIGVPATPTTRRATIDPDLGVYAIDHVPQHRHAFKTPNLRNVAVTAPYMHNGVYRTLEDVVDFYDRGGGVGLGIVLPHQTLASEPLHLSRREKADLVAFLRSLTDSAYEMPPSKAAPAHARQRVLRSPR